MLEYIFIEVFMFHFWGKREACKAAQASVADGNPSALQLHSGYTQKNHRNNS